MLAIDWFYQTPIDFEQKNYLLLQYLKSIDDSYSNLILSPYLLWTEKLYKEISSFQDKLHKIESSISLKYIDFENMKVINKEIDKNEEVKVIIEIIDYSKPLLESKIDLGYKLLKKYPQILFS